MERAALGQRSLYAVLLNTHSLRTQLGPSPSSLPFESLQSSLSWARLRPGWGQQWLWCSP